MTSLLCDHTHTPLFPVTLRSKGCALRLLGAPPAPTVPPHGPASPWGSALNLHSVSLLMELPQGHAPWLLLQTRTLRRCVNGTQPRTKPCGDYKVCGAVGGPCAGDSEAPGWLQLVVGEGAEARSPVPRASC